MDFLLLLSIVFLVKSIISITISWHDDYNARKSRVVLGELDDHGTVGQMLSYTLTHDRNFSIGLICVCYIAMRMV